MNLDDFEQRLQSQRLRQIPAEWRTEILRAASAQNSKPETRNFPWLSILTNKLSAILWPNPKAWAGLGVVWILIIGLQLAARDPAPRMANNSPPASPELVMRLKDQQRMLAELVGNNESRPAAKPVRSPAEPRSERREEQVII